MQRMPFFSKYIRMQRMQLSTELNCLLLLEQMKLHYKGKIRPYDSGLPSNVTMNSLRLGFILWSCYQLVTKSEKSALSSRYPINVAKLFYLHV